MVEISERGIKRIIRKYPKIIKALYEREKEEERLAREDWEKRTKKEQRLENDSVYRDRK